MHLPALIRSLCTAFAFVWVCPYCAKASTETDTAKSRSLADTARIRMYSARELNDPTQLSWNYDYAITGFQQCDPRNNLLRTFNPKVFLSANSNLRTQTALAGTGTILSPGKSLIYQPAHTVPGLDFGFHSFDHMKFNPEQTLFYNLKSPLTELYYVVGANEEQLFSVLHSQNINPRINAGFMCRTTGTKGFYTGQEASGVNFKTFTSLDSRNSRYHLHGQVIWNELKAGQNGGIADDSLFESAENVTKKNIAVKLYGASNSENQQVYRLDQSYDFGASSSRRINDTLIENLFNAEWRIYQTTQFQKGTVYYKDESPDIGFYTDIFYDSLATDDRIRMQKLTNTLGFVTLEPAGKSRNIFNAGFAGIHEYIQYNPFRKDTFMNNAIVKGFLSNSTAASCYWKLSGDYALSGINADDYTGELSVNCHNKSPTQQLDFTLALQNRAPAMIYRVFDGNNYRWNNDFRKQYNATAELEFVHTERHARMGISADFIRRYLYYNASGSPEQATGEIALYSGYIAKDLNWKHFVIMNMLRYQLIPDSSALRLPAFISSHSLFYHNHLFKKALYMQIGFDVLFNTAYYADAYAPATQQFHIQSQKKIGNYPYVDLFMNFRIKQAKFFVKATHVNEKFMNNTYYMVPHYPMNDMAFIAGISWRFND